MAIKYSDIVSQTQRRARKATNARGLFYLNKLVKKDIYRAVVKTFPDYFEETIEIDMIDGTTEYALPSDFYANAKTVDQNGRTILRGANTPTDVTPKNKIKIYGGNVYVSADRNFTKLVLKYYRKFPDFDETNEIALPDDIAEALESIWVNGFEYFHFSENKKTQETDVSFARYRDARNEVLTFSIGSLK